MVLSINALINDFVDEMGEDIKKIMNYDLNRPKLTKMTKMTKMAQTSQILIIVERQN